MISKTSGLAFGLGILAAVGIFMLMPPSSAGPAGSPGPVTSGQLPANHPEIPAAGAATAQGPFATVLETLNSAGYTYARVEADGEEIWVAGPVTALEPGDRISLAGAMGMQDFRAASLDRTFESILFLSAFAGPAPAPEGQSGTALEVLHAGGYTYIRVDQDGTEVWVAGMPVDAQVGQTVAWTGGAPMEGFESPSLGRTFDQILFVDGLRIQG